jgi:hypothetical protein
MREASWHPSAPTTDIGMLFGNADCRSCSVVIVTVLRPTCVCIYPGTAVYLIKYTLWRTGARDLYGTGRGELTFGCRGPARFR